MPPKRRRRFQGLYYHSSPPKVMPMNGKEANQISRRRRDADDFSVKLSTIRIWMHEKDIGKLTRILWAGQGHRLCQQASNNARIKRFLAAVPHVMNEIKDVHQAVIDNKMESLVAKLETPVPAALVQCKDANGLNIIHKAAGLGHTKILEYIIGIWPEGVHETDVTGKTPLHWAASAKNNMRCYTLLTQAGCDEEALDYKMKTPSYYRHKPHEIERAFLVYVPEAPRVSPDSTTDWEALSSDDSVGGEIKKLDIKLPEANGVTDKSMGDSIENTSELDLHDGVSAHEEDEIPKDETSEALEVVKPSTPSMPEKAAEETAEEPETESKVEEKQIDVNGVANNSNNLNEVNAQAEEATSGVDADNAQNGVEQAEEVAAQIENDETDGVSDDNVGNAENEAGNDDTDKEESKDDVAQKSEDAQESVTEHEEINPDENEVTEVDVNNETDKTEDEVEQANTGDKEQCDSDEQVLEQDHETGEKLCAKKDESEFVEETETETIEEIKNDEEKKCHLRKNSNKESRNDDDEDDDDEDVVASADANINENQYGDDNNNNHDNYNNHDNNIGDDDDAGSPTSSLAIEGFVQGESEDNTVQSQTAAYVDEDARIQQVIESGDMEQLADIVLNGDGNKLLGMKSQNMEIQAFLNNVPTYMNKIHRVHDAARDGGLQTLQQALDRRKFAVAKDEISPNGATPLHVAVLFGNVEILRYLAGRFPETMTATDNDGRTPLHYAATIKDNGHFYNILLQLGSDPKATDKLGHTPEYFFDHPIDRDILNYKQLLSSFGAEELENQLLCDQGQVENQSFQSNPIFKTEQGKYLADSLADPLIKALTEIANKRPEDPIAYLAGYLQKYVHTRKPTIEALVHLSSSNSSSTAPITSHRSSMQNAKKSNITTFGANVDSIEVDGLDLADDEDDAAQTQQLEERDEHGQSMLHFACARSHRRGGLYTLIEESHIDITYRDELYRTARDVALQANQPANAKEIDRYVISLAIVGDIKPFENLSLHGYDHVLDVTDDNGKEITEVVAEQGHEDLTDFLRNMRSLEETREELHQMIRDNNVARVKEITAASNGGWFIRTKNYYGRTALHIAVLKESTELVELFVSICPEALKVTDNLERTVLHYAMGTNTIETLSRILIQKGAKRTAKDLKGRQPSYYFMNKADILRLQEEEDENR